MEEPQVVDEDLVSSPAPARRLIIVIVEPGEEPGIETDPEESFAAWEIIAALKRASEIVEEEDFLNSIARDTDDGEETENGN